VSARWATPDGWTVEDMDLEMVPKPKRHYDAAGGDGAYLLVRQPGGTTAGFVTGQRFARDGTLTRSNTDAWADVGEHLDLRDLARTDTLALAA
jgi:hypothetical protein